jgi:arylsulfatase A-like enzyme
MNVVLFVIDTLRADHLGCYGYFRDTSPTIDRLAGEGVMFRDSHATAVATGPGFTSIITGLSPIHHKFYLTPFNIPNAINFDDNIPTLAEMIWDHGDYTTAAFDNLINFRSHMKQFVRGYEYYVNVTRTSRWIHHHVVGGEVNKRLIPWIHAHRDEKLFLFVHYWDPHTPYNQPPSYRRLFKYNSPSDLEVKTSPSGYEYVQGWGTCKEILKPLSERDIKGFPSTEEYPIDLYDGEIRYTDELIKEVISALDLAGIIEDTVIIITADHGEQLGQHGHYGHPGLHEPNIFVPMIFWHPASLPQGEIIEGYVQQADIAPTILDIISAKSEGKFDGESLLPIIKGEKQTRKDIFIETSQQRAIIRENWKLIKDAWDKVGMYNLHLDPMEVENLAEKESAKKQELEKALDKWVMDNIPEGAKDPMLVAAEMRKRATGEEEGWEMHPEV